MLRISIIVAIVLIAAALLMLAGCSAFERRMLFFPTHRPETNGLKPWVRNGETIGYAREAPEPKNVWLMLHGNAGQASDRAYALPSFSPADSVFIMEYPGYGARAGTPSKEAFNRAAAEAYLRLRETYPQIPVCVVGESIGTGPACYLASLSQPPTKLVLIVAFDKLSLVAGEHFPTLLVNLVLQDNWDNVAALRNYKGPVSIFGAQGDVVIPVSHARALADAIPSARLIIIDGGHNDWSQQGRVQIRNP